MLLHELSCHKVRLLLSVLVLIDACRNHYAIPSVDPVVSHEPRYFADEGHKALIDQLPHLLGVSNSVVSAHCNVHSFSPPPKRGRDPWAPPKVVQRLQCEGLQGLAQLQNAVNAKFAESSSL